MLDGVVFAVTAVAALGSALVSGVFFAFSSFVMPALRRIPSAEGMRAMQTVNITVISPAFMGVFLGTAVLSVALVVAAVLRRDATTAWLVLGSALYLVGVLGVTGRANAPRNDALARLDADDPASASSWRDYCRGWTVWNHVRSLAAALTSVVWVAALMRL